MDLLRAVIIGAEGTPYHDGLFFFDIQFPDTYPSVPPKVYYHSGGLRINPNLYKCGKVCLSLLGTWTGTMRENWLPKESTMLQLLVSIQALILNEKPYFNEPFYARTKGTPSGESQSRVYSENVFVLSLKTMIYSMRKPPKHFEEFVRCHFFVRSHHIVKACNAYKDGAPVGSMRSKNWGKIIQEEWKILDKNLPETIFVRACESRMDLLRAVIIGAEGTPYHDGLFFFDIQFPDTYPSVPPKVHYHSGGLRINPNLYSCGKVCLSLIRTWTGKTREKWLPKESTMLQLLVSIQALILNEKPYFNEPGYEKSIGTPSGESNSKAYSENVFLLSLKTMVYSMRKPPRHFEEFVRSHFFVRSHDIVKACNAYKNGAPVGSMVKGGVKDPAKTRQRGSKKFRTNVACFMKTVVDEFVNLGAIREANHIGFLYGIAFFITIVYFLAFGIASKKF